MNRLPGIVGLLLTVSALTVFGTVQAFSILLQLEIESDCRFVEFLIVGNP
jgi:hypothetical protein